MAVPKLLKHWNITPNLRRTYTTLIDQMGYLAYQVKVAMLAAGWTMKWSCDGVTGPTNAADNTDRIIDQTKFATRGAAAGNAQSYFVMTNADGVQFLWTYMGSADNVARISYSPAALFTLAGTTNQKPTAADECAINFDTDIVGATTSGDRVFTIWTTTESVSFAIWRATVLISYIGLEKYDSAVDTAIQTQPYINFNMYDTNRQGNQGIQANNSATPNTSGWRGLYTYHKYAGTHRQAQICYSFYTFPSTSGKQFTGGASNNAQQNQGALQNNNAMMLLPIIWIGPNDDLNNNGYIGMPIDWWLGWGTTAATPGPGDMFPGLDDTDSIVAAPRTNWLVALGSGCVRPWRNAAVSLQTA